MSRGSASIAEENWRQSLRICVTRQSLVTSGSVSLRRQTSFDKTRFQRPSPYDIPWFPGSAWEPMSRGSALIAEENWRQSLRICVTRQSLVTSGSVSLRRQTSFDKTRFQRPSPYDIPWFPGSAWEPMSRGSALIAEENWRQSLRICVTRQSLVTSGSVSLRRQTSFDKTRFQRPSPYDIPWFPGSAWEPMSRGSALIAEENWRQSLRICVTRQSLVTSGSVSLRRQTSFDKTRFQRPSPYDIPWFPGSAWEPMSRGSALIAEENWRQSLRICVTRQSLVTSGSVSLRRQTSFDKTRFQRPSPYDIPWFPGSAWEPMSRGSALIAEENWRQSLRICVTRQSLVTSGSDSLRRQTSFDKTRFQRPSPYDIPWFPGSAWEPMSRGSASIAEENWRQSLRICVTRQSLVTSGSVSLRRQTSFDKTRFQRPSPYDIYITRHALKSPSNLGKQQWLHNCNVPINQILSTPMTTENQC